MAAERIVKRAASSTFAMRPAQPVNKSTYCRPIARFLVGVHGEKQEVGVRS